MRCPCPCRPRPAGPGRLGSGTLGILRVSQALTQQTTSSGHCESAQGGVRTLVGQYLSRSAQSARNVVDSCAAVPVLLSLPRGVRPIPPLAQSKLHLKRRAGISFIQTDQDRVRISKCHPYALLTNEGLCVNVH